MPIYEFYCPKCHTIYNFLSRTINTTDTPHCPGCRTNSLQRKPSMFAITGKSDRGEDDQMDDLPIDESKMADAMASLASEAENISDDDPRAAAQLMRKLSEKAGFQYGDAFEEALSRMEAGEDPEEIEAQMGDALEGDETAFLKAGKKIGRKLPPKKDTTLYEM
ncbi:MAG: FmdB family zinc ribbon protein [Chitinivibrionales bacterium]